MSNGRTLQSSCNADDLGLHVKALEQLVREDRSTYYNLGTGTGYTVQEVITETKRISGVDFKVNYEARRPGDPAAVWADCSKSERELGWKTKYGLQTILETAWHWHSTHPTGFKEE